MKRFPFIRSRAIVVGLLTIFIAGTLVFTDAVFSQTEQFPEYVQSMEWNPEESILAVATFSGVRIYDASLNELNITPPDIRFTGSLAWSPDGTMLAVGVAPNPNPAGIPDEVSIQIWDATSFSIIQEFSIGRGDHLYLDWSPDSTQLAVSDGRLEIWDVATGEIVKTFAQGDPFPFSTLDIDWSADGRYMVASVNGGFTFWDLQIDQLLFLEPTDGTTIGVAINDEATAFAVSNEGNIEIRAIGTGDLVAVLEGEGWPMHQIKWNGNILASVNPTSTIPAVVRVWDTSNFTLLQTIESDNLRDIALTNDGIVTYRDENGELQNLEVLNP